MKDDKNWDKVPEGRERISRDHKRVSRYGRQKGALTEDFEESLQEDMRGPMEGMEEVATKK